MLPNIAASADQGIAQLPAALCSVQPPGAAVFSARHAIILENSAPAGDRLPANFLLAAGRPALRCWVRIALSRFTPLDLTNASRTRPMHRTAATCEEIDTIPKSPLGWPRMAAIELPLDGRVAKGGLCVRPAAFVLPDAPPYSEAGVAAAFGFGPRLAVIFWGAAGAGFARLTFAPRPILTASSLRCAA